MRILLLILIIYTLIIINCDMDYICDNIYLGDKYAARDEPYLIKNNIDTVVNCAESVNSTYKELKYLELKMYDKSKQKLFPKLEIAYKFIKKNSKNNILIHCKKGKSRSAALVVFYLMKENGWDYDTCIKYIRKRRSVANTNSGFKEQLKEYYNKYIKK